MRPSLGERGVAQGRGELIAVGGRLVVFRTSGDGAVELWLGREKRANRVVGCRFGAGNLVAAAA